MNQTPAIDLKLGLYEWWEDGDTTGKHAAKSLGSPGLIVTGPSPFTNAWDLSGTDCKAAISTFSLAGSWTFAFVARRMFKDSVTSSYLFQSAANADALSASGAASTVWRGIIGGTYTNSNPSYKPGRETWVSAVLVRDGNNGLLYINNTLLDNITGVGASSTTGFFKLFGEAYFEVAQFSCSERAWTADDVEFFHNAGGFINYSQL